MYTSAIMHAIECTITGRVQNVAMRAYVQDSATALGVGGWVKNLPNGTVSLYAVGTKDILKEFVEYLHEGSLGAKVEAVAVEWGTTSTTHDDFSIHYE